MEGFQGMSMEEFGEYQKYMADQIAAFFSVPSPHLQPPQSVIHDRMGRFLPCPEEDNCRIEPSESCISSDDLKVINRQVRLRQEEQRLARRVPDTGSPWFLGPWKGMPDSVPADWRAWKNARAMYAETGDSQHLNDMLELVTFENPPLASDMAPRKQPVPRSAVIFLAMCLLLLVLEVAESALLIR